MNVVRQWVPALGAVALTAAFASGCGIRPTAVPVDAGAPAVRTACPTPLHPPAVAGSTTTVPKYQAQPSRTPTPGTLSTPVPSTPGSSASALPSVAASSTSSTPPGGSIFSAISSPVPGGTASLHCG